MEPYVLGAPKRVEVGGIVFYVSTPAGLFNEWEVAARAVMEGLRQALQKEGPEQEVALVEWREKERAQEDAALAMIVGWENVVDAAGEPVSFSREALETVDVAIIRQVYLHVGEIGQQVVQRVNEGNAL